MESEYREKLAAAGFVEIEVEATRVYDFAAPEAKAILPGLTEQELRDLNGSVYSAFIRARKQL